jgi:hypothetical protein
MEMKVKAIDGIEAKSIQEVEKELLQKHDEQFNGGNDEVTIIEGTQFELDAQINTDAAIVSEAKAEMSDADILSYISNKYGRQVASVDELLSSKERDELPSDVEAFLKYKKETGRGINDFVKLNKDFDSMNPDTLLREYLSATEEGLDADDIESMLEDYSYDEDLDDESTIKKAKLAKKKAIAQAKKFFTEQKETYKQPLESSTVGVSQEAKEQLEAYQQYIQESKTYQEESERKVQWFQQKTDEVFSNEFKGFEFDLDGSKVVYTPGDASELKKAQSTPMNFINKYLDESGLMKDASGYHKALSVAMNPDRFAKFFYEQGKATAIDEDIRKAKNIDMDIRRAPEVINNGGMQIKAVDSGSGRNLKIKSKRNN